MIEAYEQALSALNKLRDDNNDQHEEIIQRQRKVQNAEDQMRWMSAALKPFADLAAFIEKDQAKAPDNRVWYRYDDAKILMSDLRFAITMMDYIQNGSGDRLDIVNKLIEIIEGKETSWTPEYKQAVIERARELFNVQS